MLRKTRQGNTTQQKDEATQHNSCKAVIFPNKKLAVSGGTQIHDHPLSRRRSYQLSYQGMYMYVYTGYMYVNDSQSSWGAPFIHSLMRCLYLFFLFLLFLYGSNLFHLLWTHPLPSIGDNPVIRKQLLTSTLNNSTSWTSLIRHSEDTSINRTPFAVQKAWISHKSHPQLRILLWILQLYLCVPNALWATAGFSVSMSPWTWLRSSVRLSSCSWAISCCLWDDFSLACVCVWGGSC